MLGYVRVERNDFIRYPKPRSFKLAGIRFQRMDGTADFSVAQRIDMQVPAIVDELDESLRP